SALSSPSSAETARPAATPRTILEVKPVAAPAASPVSTPQTPVPVATATPAAMSAADRGLSEQLNRILQHRPVRFYLKLVADPGFSSGIEELRNANWFKLLYVELALMLVMGLVRSWRLSTTTLWYRQLWTKTWTRVVFWILALTVVPWAILGEPF